jgi:hypothetical protein
MTRLKNSLSFGTRFGSILRRLRHEMGMVSTGRLMRRRLWVEVGRPIRGYSMALPVSASRRCICMPA